MANVRTIRRAFPVNPPVEQIAASSQGLLEANKVKPQQAHEVREVIVEEVREAKPAAAKKVHPSLQRASRVYATHDTDAIRRRLMAKLDNDPARPEGLVSQGAF